MEINTFINKEFWDKKETSAYLQDKGLRVGIKLLDKYITHGGGPVYRKFGRNVRYTKIDVDNWYKNKISQSFTCSSQEL